MSRLGECWRAAVALMAWAVWSALAVWIAW